MGKIVIDPVNRMEGHIGIYADTIAGESGGVRVSHAEIHGQLYRGFEQLLIGRDPRDAMVITQRICGVCPIGHGVASSQNIGTLLGYKVHHEDPVKQVPQATHTLPVNAARLRNLIHGAQHMMSHILHLYHLVALDYVKPVAFSGGAFIPLTRPFLTPRYDDNYYINTARVNAVAGLLPPAALAALTTLPGWGVNHGDAINNYLTGQYLKALNIRRICHEIATIFAGREPICSGYTPGGCTASVTQADINNYQAGLNQILAFVGAPTDFATGTAGTMMFDTVAAAYLFPEYFWIGNAYGNFMAYGWGESGFKNGISNIISGLPTTDNRGQRRGYKLSAQKGATRFDVNIMKLGESIGYSRYMKDAFRNYTTGQGFLQPWKGMTSPDPDADTKTPNGYSWLKSPRYNTGAAGYQVFEVGPLARLVVDGNYYAGVLHDLGYAVTPVWGQAGPDCAGGADPIGAALKPVYALIPGVVGGPNLSGVAYNGDSVVDRIAARTVETLIYGLLCQQYLNDLQGTIRGDGYGLSGATDPLIPTGTALKGYGMTEASRGALSHWIKMDKKGRIKNYQCVVPTTWNASPRDVNGNPGPAEKSLQGDGGTWVANPAQPIELPRITHSYDFCIACAVHLITPKGDVVKVNIPALPG